MNKVAKVIVIVILACAAVFFIPRIALVSMISNLPDRQPVEFLDDHSLSDEKTFEIERENVVVSVPTYYTNCQEVKELSAVLCDAHVKNKQLIVIYRPFNEVADKIMPGFSAQYDKLFDEFEGATLPFPVSLTHKEPDNLFGFMKDVYLADKKDCNFWSLSDMIYLHYLLKGREAMEEENLKIRFMYERDNVRSIIAEDPSDPGVYAVLILPNSRTGNIYAMVIKTSDKDDITKLLNTYEFK